MLQRLSRQRDDLGGRHTAATAAQESRADERGRILLTADEKSLRDGQRFLVPRDDRRLDIESLAPVE